MILFCGKLIWAGYVQRPPHDAPPHPIPAVEADSEADSEREVRTPIPDSGIGIPARPRHDRTAVNHPRIIRGDVDNLGASRLNDDGRVLRRYGLLRRAFKISGFLRPLAHHLYSIH